MSEPTPELLAACKIWLEEYIAGSVYWIDGPAKLAAFVQAREQAAAQRAIEEHEAALCPEDYGCKEYIAYLKQREQASIENYKQSELARNIREVMAEPKEPRGSM